MRIVINHLTRMQRGCICVAGIDVATGRHVRPMLRKQLRVEMLSSHGGPFEMGHLVDLGAVRSQGQRPEVEDYRFQEDQVRSEGPLEACDFWRLQADIAHDRLIPIFGEALQSWRGKCVMPVGQGKASLGCLRTTKPQLYLQRFEGRTRIKMRLASGRREFNVSVTDVRLYQPDHVTPNESLVERVHAHLQQPDIQALLSVGLSRRFKKAAQDPAFHFLQINNIHFADYPLWQLARASSSGRRVSRV